MASDRDALAELLMTVTGGYTRPVPFFRTVAAAVLAAGWRPPAEQVETPEGLACLRTGTVIRSRHGDIGSIDHGGVGEWTGMRTVVHLLDFVGGARLTVGNLADGEMAGSFPWTVLHPDITERPTE